MRLNPSFLIPGPPLPIWINLGVSSAIRTLLRLTRSAGSSPDSTAPPPPFPEPCHSHPDRKSTRLNSSHGYISYAVFCLKKKKNKNNPTRHQDKKTTIDSQSSTALTNTYT